MYVDEPFGIDLKETGQIARHACTVAQFLSILKNIGPN